MPKMQVYLPDDLYERVKSQGPDLNVSGVLQEALEKRLAHIERLQALAAAVAEHEHRNGAFTSDDLVDGERRDRAAAVRPGAAKKSARPLAASRRSKRHPAA